MKYDFVEIGTSDFDALIQTATDATRGISIEPIQYYLDRLPNPAGVIKLCCAVSTTGRPAMLEMYYVPDAVIHEHQLPDWLRGCNSIGAYHLQHTKLCIEHLVQMTHVPCYPLSRIFEQHQVTELDMLKIDTEGQDADILLNYADNMPVRPKKIVFESNELSSADKIKAVIDRYVDLGYCVSQAGSDTVLEISDT
jgi:FkbM family methyltransferase